MLPYEFNAERFSRWMAYVLRHNPERYGLQPDQHGYVDLAEFVRIAKSRYPELSPDRLREFVAENVASRFEVTEVQVRARYGHSISVQPVGPSLEPPEFLYFGTEVGRVEAIQSEGLSPTDRQILHLSATKDEALSIAQRKTDQPAVICIHAKTAHEAGIAFHQESALYLVPHIPAQFITLEPQPDAAASPSTPD